MTNLTSKYRYGDKHPSGNGKRFLSYRTKERRVRDENWVSEELYLKHKFGSTPAPCAPNPYADLPDTLPEQERTERIKDEEYNKHPAYMYLLQMDPIHFSQTLNAGVTTRKPSSRLTDYRRHLDYNHPFADCLDYWLLARVPRDGKVVEKVIHEMMNEHGPRHGPRREEWTINTTELISVIQGFYRIINEFGGEIIVNNTAPKEVA